MDKRKLYYYKNIVKRNLNNVKERIDLSKNEMERNYYQDRYAVQLGIFADALGVSKKYLKRFV